MTSSFRDIGGLIGDGPGIQVFAVAHKSWIPDSARTWRVLLRNNEPGTMRAVKVVNGRDSAKMTSSFWDISGFIGDGPGIQVFAVARKKLDSGFALR